jgi:hypothetical protein
VTSGRAFVHVRKRPVAGRGCAPAEGRSGPHRRRGRPVTSGGSGAAAWPTAPAGSLRWPPALPTARRVGCVHHRLWRHGPGCLVGGRCPPATALRSCGAVAADAATSWLPLMRGVRQPGPRRRPGGAREPVGYRVRHRHPAPAGSRLRLPRRVPRAD